MPTQGNNRKAALTKSRTTERNKKNNQTYKNTKRNLWKYKQAYNATARNKPRTKAVPKTPKAGGRRNTRRRR